MAGISWEIVKVQLKKLFGDLKMLVNFLELLSLYLIGDVLDHSHKQDSLLHTYAVYSSFIFNQETAANCKHAVEWWAVF